MSVDVSRAPILDFEDLAKTVARQAIDKLIRLIDPQSRNLPIQSLYEVLNGFHRQVVEISKQVLQEYHAVTTLKEKESKTAETTQIVHNDAGVAADFDQKAAVTCEYLNRLSLMDTATLLPDRTGYYNVPTTLSNLKKMRDKDAKEEVADDGKVSAMNSKNSVDSKKDDETLTLSSNSSRNSATSDSIAMSSTDSVGSTMRTAGLAHLIDADRINSLRDLNLAVTRGCETAITIPQARLQRAVYPYCKLLMMAERGELQIGAVAALVQAMHALRGSSDDAKLTFQNALSDTSLIQKVLPLVCHDPARALAQVMHVLCSCYGQKAASWNLWKQGIVSELFINVLLCEPGVWKQSAALEAVFSTHYEEAWASLEGRCGVYNGKSFSEVCSLDKLNSAADYVKEALTPHTQRLMVETACQALRNISSALPAAMASKPAVMPDVEGFIVWCEAAFATLKDQPKIRVSLVATLRNMSFVPAYATLIMRQSKLMTQLVEWLDERVPDVEVTHHTLILITQLLQHAKRHPLHNNPHNKDALVEFPTATLQPPQLDVINSGFLRCPIVQPQFVYRVVAHYKGTRPESIHAAFELAVGIISAAPNSVGLRVKLLEDHPDVIAAIGESMALCAQHPAGIQSICCFARMLAHRSEVTRKHLHDAGFTAKCVSALLTHRSYLGCVTEAAAAIRTLTAGNVPDVRKLCVESGAVPLLMDVLKRFADSANTAESACGALRNLCVDNDTASQQITEQVDTFIEVASRHIKSSAVSEAVCSLFRNILSGKVTRKQQLVKAGVLELLKQVLDHHVREAAVVEAACGAIRNAVSSNDDDGRNRAVKIGIIDTLLLAVENNASNATTVEMICAAVRNITGGFCDMARDRCVESGLVMALVMHIPALQTTPRLAKSVMDTLRNIAWTSTDIREHLLDLDVLHFIGNILKDSAPNSETATAALALLAKIVEKSTVNTASLESQRRRKAEDKLRSTVRAHVFTYVRNVTDVSEQLASFLLDE